MPITTSEADENAESFVISWVAKKPSEKSDSHTTSQTTIATESDQKPNTSMGGTIDSNKIFAGAINDGVNAAVEDFKDAVTAAGATLGEPVRDNQELLAGELEGFNNYFAQNLSNWSSMSTAGITSMNDAITRLSSNIQSAFSRAYPNEAEAEPEPPPKPPFYRDGTGVELDPVGEVKIANDIYNVAPEPELKATHNWYCTEVITTWGSTPGKAFITVPFSGGMISTINDENADQNYYSELEIGIGDEIYIHANDRLIFQGFITKITRDRSSDSLQLICQDYRWIMRDCYIVGRIMGTISAGLVNNNFQMGWPAHFNPGGRPNCIHDKEARPWFTPYPDWGLDPGEEPANPATNSMTKACYWTIEKIMIYLRNSFSAATVYPKEYGWINRVPVGLEWPENFYSPIESDNFFDQKQKSEKGANRKGRDINLAGMSILDALNLLLTTAGGYALNISYSGNKPTIQTVSTINRGSDGDGITLPATEASKPTTKAYITSGELAIDGEDIITGVGGKGDLVMIETRVNQYEKHLTPAWTEAEENTFKAYVGKVTGGVQVNNNELGWKEAVNQWPNVFTAYRLSSDFNFQVGTSEAGKSLIKMARPPWPRQLTKMSLITDFAGLTYPIYIESNMSGTGVKSWLVADKFDGLEVLDNGIILIPSLKEPLSPVRNWRTTTTPAYPFPLPASAGSILIYPCEIRMNITIPCDHALYSYIDAIKDDRVHITRESFVDTSPNPGKGLYKKHLRHNSWPLEESNRKPATQATDGFITHDGEYLDQHLRLTLLNRGLLRTIGNPTIDGHLVPDYKVGQVASMIKSTTTGKHIMINQPIYGLRWSSAQGDPPMVKTEILFE